MATLSSVPKIEFTPAGLIVPSQSDVLAGVQADIDAAFGGGLNPALETPQGQLASSQAAVIGDKNDEFAYFVNQIDPQFSSGRFQDAIARLYFLDRKGATSTSVQVTLTGLPGVVVPAGVLAQDSNGETYINTGDATIGPAGTVTATFENVNSGPIPCAAGSLTQIYQAVIGWDAITNPAAGVMGNDVESRSDFEYRRKNSVAFNANGTPGAIYANVFAVDNVLDVYVIDNPTGSTVNKGSTNYPVIANSVYVAVVGGSDEEIAKAIFRKKDLGCSMNGNTTVVVTDESGYSYPQPTYSIKFNRPTAIPIKFEVSVVDDPSLPSNAVDLIKAAIIARFNGADGSTRERVGSAVFASRYYSPVSLTSQNVAVVSILIGTSTPTLSKVDVGIDQSPTVTASDIVVTLV